MGGWVDRMPIVFCRVDPHPGAESAGLGKWGEEGDKELRWWWKRTKENAVDWRAGHDGKGGGGVGSRL
jgi:hypothetical protein